MYSTMSGTISSRSSSQEVPQIPSTPETSRISSYSIAPKSEYLRNALHARRAQQTPTPTPSEFHSPPPPAPKFEQPRTTDSSPDAFAEFALSEEQMAPVSPIRRRRPSDAAMPRSKTNKELTQEIERVKESLMTSKMRVELLKKDHSKLQHELTKSMERVEMLEPLEQENLDLQEENDQLRYHLESMEEDMARLKDDNELVQELQNENYELRKTNEELTAIASESATHMQNQENAIEEAVECIIKMEEEKNVLTDELKHLKERITALEMASPASTLVDGQSGYPSRIFSVDESRPSTSHFDSDYYSQPESPEAKSTKASTASLAPSTRSKKFIDLNEERRRSARDLVNRMSMASLSALSTRSPSPPPKMPLVPLEYRQPKSQTLLESQNDSAPRTPARLRLGRQAVSRSLLEEAQQSPTRRSSTPRQRSMPRNQGVRGPHRPETLSRSQTTHDVLRYSRAHNATPTNATRVSLEEQPLSQSAISPGVPSRGSSKHAHTDGSEEHLQHQVPRYRVLSESDPEPSSESRGDRSNSPSPQDPSLLSQSDLTPEADPRDYKEKHWRDLDRLTLPQVLEQQRRDVERSHRAQSRATQNRDGYREKSARDSSGRKDGQQSSSLDSLRMHAEGQDRQSRTQPSTPRVEKNFLFKHEDEDTFLQKARAKFSLRR